MTLGTRLFLHLLGFVSGAVWGTVAAILITLFWLEIPFPAVFTLQLVKAAVQLSIIGANIGCAIAVTLLLAKLK